MTTAGYIERFKGGRLIEVQRDVEKRLGVNLGETWLSEHCERMFDAFRVEGTDFSVLRGEPGTRAKYANHAWCH
jgi:hypothetical protein